MFIMWILLLVRQHFLSKQGPGCDKNVFIDTYVKCPCAYIHIGAYVLDCNVSSMIYEFGHIYLKTVKCEV